MTAIVAQTFFVSSNVYPEGLFLSSVDLFFASKDSSGLLPVEIQLRTIRNGFPAGGFCIPNSRVFVDANRVRVSDIPNTSDSTTATTFTFPAPVYLQGGFEYALIVKSDSPEYVLFSAKIGEQIIGENRIVSKQPSTGVLYRPNGNLEWLPYNDEDLMFVLRKCVFTTNSTGSALFNVSAPSANVEMDAVYLRSEDIKFASSLVDYSYKATLKSTGIVDASFSSILPNKDYDFSDGLGRRIIANSNHFVARTQLSTTNQDVSPFIDTQRIGLITIQNIVNNANLSNSIVVVTDGGSGHTSPTVTISGGNGTGATGVANVQGGVVRNISITSFGSGYTTTPTITISEGGATRNASAIILGETGPAGGNYLARYISRRVQLNDGFESSDLRVFLTAYKPPGTGIEVYYKVISADDTDDFDNKNYFKMEQFTPASVTSTNYNDYIEYEFRPSLSNSTISYNSSGVTYDTFKTFAIKIALSTNDTTLVPKVQDMRVIALPD